MALKIDLAFFGVLSALSLVCSYAIEHHVREAPYVVTMALVAAMSAGGTHMLLVQHEKTKDSKRR